MALPDLIRSVIATAKRIVDPMMMDVDHRMVVGRDQHGPIYADELVPRRALVEDVGENVISEDGTERMATSKLTFLEPVPIDLLDVFVVNGEEVNVAKRGGLLDEDGVAYYREVWLGTSRFR